MDFDGITDIVVEAEIYAVFFCLIYGWFSEVEISAAIDTFLLLSLYKKTKNAISNEITLDMALLAIFFTLMNRNCIKATFSFINKKLH